MQYLIYLIDVSVTQILSLSSLLHSHDCGCHLNTLPRQSWYIPTCLSAISLPGRPHLLAPRNTFCQTRVSILPTTGYRVTTHCVWKGWSLSKIYQKNQFLSKRWSGLRSRHWWIFLSRLHHFLSIRSIRSLARHQGQEWPAGSRNIHLWDCVSW